MDRLLAEERNMTFTPTTNYYPGATASLQIRAPETCEAFWKLRQKQHEEHAEAQRLQREVNSAP